MFKVSTCMVVGWCLCLGLRAALAQAPAPAPTDPPGTIVLLADAKAGVKLTGKAKLEKTGGKADYLESVGMAGQPIVSLGLWNKSTTEESRVEFAPTLPRDGYYDVYVRWYSGPLAGNAVIKDLPIKVVSAAGERTFEFGQQMGNVWVFLGTYPFKAGNSGRVSADAKDTHGAANLNGVKFVPTSQPPAAMPLVLPTPKGTPDDFDKMRIRLAQRLTATAQADLSDPILADKIAQQEANAYFYWKTMRLDPDRRQAWTDPTIPARDGNNEGGGWPLGRQYDYLLAMTRSYVGGNAPLGFAAKMQGNPQLRQDILDALNFFYETRFNEKTVNKLGADWIGNEIGNPRVICTIICLLYPHVSRDFIARQTATFEHMAPTPLKMYGGAGTTTGFNRMAACYAYALRGLIENNAKKIEMARSGINDEFLLNNRSKPLARGSKTSFDGFYADGSFIQHGELPYIGIYGGDVLTSYVPLKALLEGSPWEINDPRAQVLNQWVTRGFAPLFFGGDIMYGSLGRSAGQSWHQNGTVSSRVMDAVAQLVPLAKSPAERQELSAILKAWLSDKQQSALPQFNQFDASRISLPAYLVLTQIKNDPNIKPQRPAPGSYVFHNTDMVIHHQPDFAAQLRMFSTRIRTHEDINEGTNRLGWYQGEGALFLYTRDNSRYNDNFWATVNPYRLPGTTVDTRDREKAGSKNGELSQSPWAGGAELDGMGVASMGLLEPGTTLAAQKSWFFLDGQIVCLGSRIKSTDNRAIETIVENVKLSGTGNNAFVVNGQNQPTDLGWKANLKDVRWAHLAGPVPGTDMGWVFPQPAALQAVREARTGTWDKWFRKDANTAPHTRTYLTLWYDHGVNPAGASYAYIILPGMSSVQTQEYARKPGVEVLANTAELQAVRYAGRSTVAASVWTDAPTPLGEVTITGKCNVMVSDDGKRIRLAVSDPTQQRTEAIRLVFKQGVGRVVQADDGIKVESLNPLTVLVNVAQSDGKTYRADFAR